MAADYFNEVELGAYLTRLSGFTTSPDVAAQIKNADFLSESASDTSYRIIGKFIDIPDLPDLYIPAEYEEYFSNIDIKGYHLDLEKIIHIYNVEAKSSTLLAFVKQAGLENEFPIVVNKKFLNAVSRIIDLEGSIKRNASSLLSELHKKRDSLQASMRRKIDDLLRKYRKQKYLQEDFFTLKDGRFVLPIRSNFKNKVPGIIHSISSTGQTTYIEPMEIVYANNSLTETYEELRREEIRLLTELTSLINDDREIFLNNCALHKRAEYFIASAKFLKAYKFSIPSSSDKMKLIGARHPVLQWRYEENTGHEPVGFDLDMKDFKMLLISGPNTGGKTITLKTVAICALLRKMGLPLPSDWGSAIPYYPRIFIDIGDRQNISDSLSTFSAHLIKLREALNTFDNGDLAIFDEPGTGTEPRMADCFAMSLVDFLLEKAGDSLLTTHSGVVKEYISSKKETMLASMIFDVEKMAPTYLVKYGLSGESYALEIGARLQLSPEFLRKVKGFLGNEYTNYLESKGELDRLIKENITMENDLNEKATQLEGRDRELKKRLSDVEKNYKNEFLGKFEELKRDYEELKKEIAPLKKEKKVLFEKIFINKEEQLQALDPGEKKGDVPTDLFAKGNLARIANSSDYYEIIETAGDLAKLMVGDLVLEVERSMIVSLTEGGNEEKAEPFTVTNIKTRDKIDIRGMRVEEALPDVEAVLNEAYVAGFANVYILHGKGTGKLKEGIRAYLSTHPLVDNYNDSYEGEQHNAGITVAELKKR